MKKAEINKMIKKAIDKQSANFEKKLNKIDKKINKNDKPITKVAAKRGRKPKVTLS